MAHIHLLASFSSLPRFSHPIGKLAGNSIKTFAGQARSSVQALPPGVKIAGGIAIAALIVGAAVLLSLQEQDSEQKK